MGHLDLWILCIRVRRLCSTAYILHPKGWHLLFQWCLWRSNLAVSLEGCSSAVLVFTGPACFGMVWFMMWPLDLMVVCLLQQLRYYIVWDSMPVNQAFGQPPESGAGWHSVDRKDKPVLGVDHYCCEENLLICSREGAWGKNLAFLWQIGISRKSAIIRRLALISLAIGMGIQRQQ